jgi:hypothetical protein
MSARTPIDPATFPPCPKCNQQHIRRERRQGVEVWYETCTAHRSNGAPCKKYAVNGAKVCERDGAAAGTPARAAADRRVLEDSIRKTMASELVRVNPDTMRTDPIQGLMWEVAMSAQAVEWLALQVADLNVPRPNGGEGALRDFIGVDDDGEPIMAQPSGQLWGPTHTGDLGTHVLYEMWNDERERHARMCAHAIKAGVSERMVAIAESQGTQIVSVIIYVIDHLPGATAAMKVEARTLAAQRLRELGPAAAAAIPVTATG